MAQNLQLSDEVYDDLKKLAEASSVTPEEWVRAKVSAEIPKEFKERPLREALEGHVGVLDSSGNPDAQYRKEAFGEIVTKKLEKQGIKKP